MWSLLSLLLSTSSTLARAADGGVTIDATRVLVLSNAEVVAMGGAGAAFVAAAPGAGLSPAAPASRREESVSPVVASLVLTSSGLTERRDTENLDRALSSVGRMYNVGVALAAGRYGGGLVGEGTYASTGTQWVGLTQWHLVGAASLAEGHLAVGLGARGLTMGVIDGDAHRDSFGVGVEGGAVVSNLGDAWNVALTVRSPVTAHPFGEPVGGIAAASLPYEVVGGVGWGNRGRLPAGRGVPVRVAADVVVDGPVADGRSLGAWLDGDEVERGATMTVTPRVGGEVDVWPERLRLRAGTYLEPTRTAESALRPHVTGGVEVRLFPIQAFQGRVRLDLAWQVALDWSDGYVRGAFLGVTVWRGGRIGGEPSPGVRSDG